MRIMNPDRDEVINPGAEEIEWETKEASQGNVPNPQYSILTEQARNLISLEKQCALFCGGRRCKYERADCWPNQTVIQGLFSHWVTDNILAMARPNTASIKEFNIIQQFHDTGIKTVINLQQSGEHASCGPGLDPSGFSYNPQDFMDSDIYFYNFGCPDFGATSNSTILDMVRVMQFALSEGKVAIHCHAGLGRTGLLICCYLVFTNRMSANDAIHYVREKRPRSIQTRRQMQSLKDFADYLQQLWVICTFTEGVSCEFTLQQYLSRQRKLLHGYEARKLKYIPKIVYFVCERLLELAERGNALASTSAKTDPEMSGTAADLPGAANDFGYPNISSVVSSSSSSKSKMGKQVGAGGPSAENESLHRAPSALNNHHSNMETLQGWWKYVTETNPKCLKAKAIAIAFCDTTFEESVLDMRDDLKLQLNSSDDGWRSIAEESDPLILAALLWDWLNRLKEPVLRYTDLKTLLSYVNDPLLGISTLEKSPHAILDYLSRVVLRLLPLPSKLLTRLIEMLLSHITHHYISTDYCQPLWRCDHWLDLQPATPKELLTFFKSLVKHNQKKLGKSVHFD